MPGKRDRKEELTKFNLLNFLAIKKNWGKGGSKAPTPLSMNPEQVKF